MATSTIEKIKTWANKWKSRLDTTGDRILKAGQILADNPQKTTEANK